ncbi:MAG: aminoacyl-histidine dipeptidase, partial [Clostridia bacterium]|nr:aminoacyl-histidine dipeptidase [Clostridia bacterium]
MKNIISDIEPKGVMKYFELLSAVPRGSGRTRAAAQFCVNFAKEHNLEYYTDETGNVVIYKNASPGCENEDSVIIQGHLDMVWEKAPGVDFDFETQGLKLAVDG